jgi:hypothetical protein
MVTICDYTNGSTRDEKVKFCEMVRPRFNGMEDSWDSFTSPHKVVEVFLRIYFDNGQYIDMDHMRDYEFVRYCEMKSKGEIVI